MSKTTMSLCSRWYYPQHIFFGPFAAVAVAYTVAIHSLFRYGLVSAPEINYPGARDQKESISPARRRVAIVTGSNTGVGFETAKQLVTDYGIEVILACRNEAKGRNAAEDINQLSHKGGRAIFVCPCDLSSFASVHSFANAIHEKYDKIHILVNNAGLNTTGRSKDGYDLLFQSCFLGHFLLTNLLFDLFPQDGSGRIVNLSSVKHHFQCNNSGWVTFDENHWKNSALREYRRNQSYPNAKQAAIFFTLEINRRYFHREDTGNPPRVRAFAANPGAVNSDIWRSSRFRWLLIPIYRQIFLTTQQGAATSVAAAVGEFDNEQDYYLEPYWIPASARATAPFPVWEMLGAFVGYDVIQPRLPKSRDGIQAAGESLWAVSEELTRLPFGKEQRTGSRMSDSDATTDAAEVQRNATEGFATGITKRKDTTARKTRPAMGTITNIAPTKKQDEN